MKHLFSRYGAFLGQPGVVRLLVTAFVARMPIGMVSLALLMHLRDLTSSFAFAGAVVGGYLVAMAAAAPAIGRLVDRRGLAIPLVVTGIVQPLALGAVLFAGPLGLSRANIAACAAIAGAFAPPISVLARTLWRHRFDGDDERRIAFSFDSVLVELNFTLGPALVALLLAVATPAAALGAAWLFVAAAAPLFLSSPAPKYWKRVHEAERHLLGPLTEPRLLVVYATTSAFTFAFGLLEVGYPGFAAAIGAPAAGGVLIAICSIGSAIGGLAYGGIQSTLPVERQLPRITALMVPPLAAHALVASPWLLAPLAFCAGLLMAPALTAVTILVSHHAPARYATEAFTWSTACIVSSVGAGMAAGGALIQAWGPAAAFGTAAASVVLASLLGLLLQPPAVRVR